MNCLKCSFRIPLTHPDINNLLCGFFKALHVPFIEHKTSYACPRQLTPLGGMKFANRLIPNRLRIYRLKMGYEQIEVAFLLGLKSHARVSEWEAGISKPSLDNLLQLSMIYRTMPDELYYDLRQEFLKDIRKREKILLVARSLKQDRDTGG